MRVGLYLHNYVPTSGGGYTFQREIFKAISKLSHQSVHEFFLITHPQESIQRDSLDSIEIILVEQPSSYLEQSVSLKKTSWFKSKQKQIDQSPHRSQDVISAFDYTVWKHNIEFVWFLTPAYELTNVPYIATVWDLQHRLQPWFPEVGNLLEWNGRESYISTYLRRAAYIIAPNEAGKKEVHLFYQIPEDRVICLPHPAPELVSVTEKDEQDILGKYGLQPGFLFYPAQYWAHKNHAGLLYALKMLKEIYCLTLPVVFVGSDKGNIVYIKNLAVELNVQSQVHFLGFVTDSEMTVFYKNALALVYVSFFGPENLPPLEAFSLGCPVIASCVNGASEQFGEAALLVTPASTNEIALAIKSLLDDQQLRQTLITRGFEQIKNASSDDYVKRVFTLLDEFSMIRRTWGNGDA